MTQIAVFLALTFSISMIAFLSIARIDGAQSPDGPIGLPFWLIAVWGPSLAAMVLAYREGTLGTMLARAIDFGSVPAAVWCFAGAPLLVLALVATIKGGMPGVGALSIGLIAKLIALNLILGPLGEEFGWRGFLQPVLTVRYGWLVASLIVGAVWFLWHTPLWLVDSPQSQIPMPIFAGHVMAYAIIMGAMMQIGGPSLAPMILFHLAVNTVAGLAFIGGLGTSADFYRWSLVPYGALAAVSVIWVMVQQGFR